MVNTGDNEHNRLITWREQDERILLTLFSDIPENRLRGSTWFCDTE